MQIVERCLFMKNYILLLTLIMISSTMVGCSTIKGIGKDISAIGRGLSSASERVSSDLKGTHK